MNPNEFKILLIDDDEDDYVNIRALLQELPRSQHLYRITWKSSYQKGLEALAQQKFDACLLDYRLGERTGLELLQEAQKLGSSVCPIIFLTGQGDFDIDLRVMQIGAADYLVKSQLNAPLLERAIRYSMKNALDMEELRESKAQIIQQDRLASLGLLASSLAHEIGTPLGIIRSRAELAEKKAGENNSLKHDMEIIISQIDKITKLVNSLLHLAREKPSNLATTVNVNQVMDDVLNLVKHELDRKNINLEVKIQDVSLVKAESGLLGQVLLNLLVNSMHAIEEARRNNPENEKTTAHQINLDVKNLTDSVEISIRDTGCGIPEKNLSQIFKPFFTTKDIGVGTGLGLAISYKLVQSWNGSIKVESSNSPENQGTTFIIKLLKAV